jgi:hypothetical protein
VLYRGELQKQVGKNGETAALVTTKIKILLGTQGVKFHYE